MFVRNSRIINPEYNFSKGRVRIWFFGIDWFQIAAIVKWPLVTRLLGEPQVSPSASGMIGNRPRTIRPPITNPMATQRRASKSRGSGDPSSLERWLKQSRSNA